MATSFRKKKPRQTILSLVAKKEKKMEPRILWSIIVVGLTIGIVAFLGLDGPNKLRQKFGKKQNGTDGISVLGK